MARTLRPRVTGFAQHQPSAPQAASSAPAEKPSKSKSSESQRQRQRQRTNEYYRRLSTAKLASMTFCLLSWGCRAATLVASSEERSRSGSRLSSRFRCVTRGGTRRHETIKGLNRLDSAMNPVRPQVFPSRRCPARC
jgi:hypothetical protein